MVNLYRVFSETAERQPDRHACIDAGRSGVCTYAELKRRIDVAAETLQRTADVSPGDSVGLHYRSGLDYIVWAYAIWKCGATIVPIAVELAAQEKHEICHTIRLNGVVSSAAGKSIFSSFQKSADVAIGMNATYLPLRQVCDDPDGFSGVNAAFIRFTSGTTAASKGVVLSHETVLERINAANEGLEIDSNDVIVWLLSMSYHFTVSIVAYLSFGATIVLCENHFGATIVKAASDYDATFLYGSPQHYQFMADSGGELTLPRLRLAISTATPLTKKTAEAFYSRFGVQLRQAYGLIEVGLPCINLGENPSDFASLGRPLPAYEIRLRAIPGDDHVKAIDVRGKGVADAYYKPWKLRQDFMRDGWFETGDIGYQDPMGNIYIVGRTKEMLSVGGMKLFPQEVERVLLSHVGIKEARVFASEHSRLGEIPHAEVVVESGLEVPSEAQLKEHCRKCLSAYKVPERISIVDKIAKTASGKPLRRKSTG